MAETDFFNFSKLCIFEKFKETLPEDAGEIIDIHEDLLFKWDTKECCLKVVNWRSATKIEKDAKFQILVPSSTQNFSVTKVTVSFGGSFAAISGPQGLSILELPTRWGSDGLYHDGKPRITCKVVTVHESATNQLNVLQVRWHPSSPSDSHLLVLYSDNSLRIYDEGNLKHLWRVGPVPTQSNTGKKFSFMESLGDTAIDFDIAPAQICNEMSPRRIEQRVEWPIVILRGNGTIYVLLAGFNSEKPQLQGPLTMIPSNRDNYGDDSCSILVISHDPSQPITLVVAENSGILHHALMIESKSTDSSFADTTTTNDWDLYVLETIQLELGLQGLEDVQPPASASIYLKRDPINDHRYFCYNKADLHGITLGYVNELQKFIEHDNEEEFNARIPSKVEHILTTRAFNSSKVNAIVGFGMFQSPSGILVLMSSGQVVSLGITKTLPTLHSLNPQLPNLEHKIIKEDPKIPFDQQIKTILNPSGVMQRPILKLDRNSSPSMKQSFSLLLNTIQFMRDQQFTQLDKVRQQIIQRVKILELMKNQQRDEISLLLECKKTIQDKATKLADMHEDIWDRQTHLQKRINDMCRLASLKVPTLYAHEKEFCDHVKRIKVTVDKLSQDSIQIKAKHDAQIQSEKFTKNKDYSFNENPLPPKQEECIKEFIGDMMRQIQGLKMDVQKIYNVIDN